MKYINLGLLALVCVVINIFGMESKQVASASTIQLICNDTSLTSDAEFKVDRSVLETSGVFKEMLYLYEKSGMYPERFPVGLSAEEFLNLLPLLELALQDEKTIKTTLGGMTISELAQVIGLANKYDRSALLEYGIPILAEKLKQPDELEKCVHNENYIPSLGLSSEMQAAVASEIDKNSERFTILRQVSIPSRQTTIPENIWHNSYVYSWSPDGKWLASVPRDSAIRTGLLAQWVQKLKGEEYGPWIHAVCVSPDGERVASGFSDKNIYIWDVPTEACVRTLKGHSDWIMSVCWSSDGKWLASGSADKNIYIWDMSTGACVRTLKGHSDLVYAVCWSPDGKWLASGSTDKTIIFWDMSDFLHAASELKSLDFKQALSLEYLHSHYIPQESINAYFYKYV